MDIGDPFISAKGEWTDNDSNTCGAKASLPNSRDTVTIAFVNVNGLRNKVDEIGNILVEKCIDILFVAETKIDERIPTRLLSIEEYKLFRRDRDSRGGGMACYCRPGLKPIWKKSLQSPMAENLVLAVKYGQKGLVLNGFYRPPGQALTPFLEQWRISVEDCLRNSGGTVCVGDMNVNTLDPVSGDARKLSDFLANYSLIHNQAEFTRPESRTLLDHFYLSKPEEFGPVATIAVGFTNHSLLTVETTKSHFFERKRQIKYRNWKHSDFNAFNADISSIDWDCVYRTQDGDIDLDGNKVMQKWDEHLFAVINRHAPIKTKQISPSTPPWFSQDIKAAIRRRDRVAKSVHAAADKALFRQLRNRVTSLKRTCREKYFSRLLVENGNSRHFHNAIQRTSGLGKSQTNNSDISLFQNHRLVTSQTEVANILNTQYVSVARGIHCLAPENCPSVTEISRRFGGQGNPLNFQFVSSRMVQKIIRKMPANKAPGEDRLKMGLIKRLPALVVPLTDLINYFIWTDTFPDRWKRAVVRPLFKKGDENDPKNYRPVSLLPAFSKIFERVLYVQIFDWFKDKINPDLMGFMPNKSCETALLSVTEQCRKSVDDGKYTSIFSLDFSKAFDTINHELLLAKVSAYGCATSASRLLKSYLSGRIQVVHLGADVSTPAGIESGVPQGSILGPLLFNIFVNDMSWIVTKSEISRFADDTTLMQSATRLCELELMANEDMNAVSRWSCENGLLLNPQKTPGTLMGKKADLSACEFMIDDSPLVLSEEVRILVVTLDSRLSYAAHVTNLLKVVGLKACQLRYATKFLASKTRLNMLKIYVLPHLSYCSALFVTMSDGQQQRMLTAERKAVRCAMGLRRRESVSDLMSIGKTPDCIERAAQRTIEIVRGALHTDKYPIVSALLSRTNRVRYNTRGNRLVSRAFASNFGKRSFSAVATRLWNQLPPAAQETKKRSEFKSFLSSQNIRELLRVARA